MLDHHGPQPMGRVAQMAVRATEVALEDAGLKDDAGHSSAEDAILAAAAATGALPPARSQGEDVAHAR